jgi:hypothetical protein
LDRGRFIFGGERKMRTIAQTALAADRAVTPVIMMAGAKNHSLRIHPSDVRVKSNHSSTVAFITRGAA